MGLMMRRRRPMMRMAAGAATAGVAYHMGKKGQQQADVNDQAQMAYASSQEAPAPAVRAPAPASRSGRPGPARPDQHRPVDQPGRAAQLRSAHRRRVRGGQGQDPRHLAPSSSPVPGSDHPSLALPTKEYPCLPTPEPSWPWPSKRL